MGNNSSSQSHSGCFSNDVVVLGGNGFGFDGFYDDDGTGDAAGVDAGNSARRAAQGFEGDPVVTAGTSPLIGGAGSQQNTQGWKWGDPVCPFDRVSYTKRVAERILYDLNKIDNTNSFWTGEEKKKVSEGVGVIACNLHENWCTLKTVIENAIGRPVTRIGS